MMVKRIFRYKCFCKELCDILTMTGSKVEGLETKGDNIKNVVVEKYRDWKTS